MGVAAPQAGRSALQDTFSALDHVNGRPVSVDVPSRFGPRQCGQSAASGAVAQKAQATRVTKRVMLGSTVVGSRPEVGVNA